ncbi:uncharacterized protein BXZ73DRAFT_43019 [Epithele typhae]|uniref:uncharacterized protein n=1 Tax=Epithele typhae TaxID=378194 RepID=UPI00200788D3|nr:uncharacterized protein BXZ73DRAFT_43019 [Epithele typhae]KAH9940165.1 hypothetical protein BXZ73DRAFT_43019 [Epithele typhae]
MYCLSTTHVAMALEVCLIAFFKEHSIEGGLTIFNDQGNPLIWGEICIELINCLIGDGIVCWRTYVLYGRNWRILVFPVICISGGTAAGIGMINALSRSEIGAQVFAGDITNWFVAFGVLTFLANLYSVGMITYKAWTNARLMKGLHVNVGSGSRYWGALLLIIESGAVYCVALVTSDASLRTSHTGGRCGGFLGWLLDFFPRRGRLRDGRRRPWQFSTAVSRSAHLTVRYPPSPRSTPHPLPTATHHPASSNDMSSPDASAEPPGRHPKAYVREARREELPAVIECLTRAFADCPAMNWYGSVGALVTDVNAQDPATVRTMGNLRHFQRAIAVATMLSNGVVTVVCIPADDEGQGEREEEPAESRGKKKAKAKATTTLVDGENGREHVVAASLWLRPGQTLDMGPLLLLRVGIHKLVKAWGLTGIKRVLFEFTPKVEQALERAFSAKGLDRLDSWHLLEIVTDPEHENRGYASMLMKDGFIRTSPKPVHLEAADPHCRDIYLHYGFEINEEHTYGIGDVNDIGIKAKGAAATGYPEWIMTKVNADDRDLFSTAFDRFF